MRLVLESTVLFLSQLWRERTPRHLLDRAVMKNATAEDKGKPLRAAWLTQWQVQKRGDLAAIFAGQVGGECDSPD